MEIPGLKIDFDEEQRNIIHRRMDECLKNGQLFQGKYVELFEAYVEARFRCRHAIAVNSGSSAIEIAMKILGVKDKEVLVPTNTFLATAAAVRNAGGRVRLVDTAEGSLLVDLAELKKKVTERTAGVILVHIGGLITPDIIAIREWCTAMGLWLFEDAAHAHGSEYKNAAAGTFGIAGSYSLFATKIITCGEGGILVTDDDDFAEKARLYRNHGKIRDWETYSIIEGFNYRMSEITACIALTQIERLDVVIEKRTKAAGYYTQLLAHKLKLQKADGPCGWYKYIVMLPTGIMRDEVRFQLKEKGIHLQGEVYAIPLHKQPIAEVMGLHGSFPHADDVCSRHICLPIYPDLDEEKIRYVSWELLKILS